MAAIVAGLAALLVLRLLSGWLTLTLALAVLAPYVAVSSLQREQLDRIPPPRPFVTFLRDAVTSVERDTRRDQRPKRGGYLDALSLIPALAAVVLGSYAMVRAATELGHDRGWSPAVLGTLVLAVLTGVPNTIAALQLARHGRGTAVLSEALNSNSINIVAGLCVPAVLLGPLQPSTQGLIALAALGVVTIAGLAFCSMGAGLRRLEGAALLALYCAFVVLVIVV